jgi:putative redox protein
LFGVEPKRRNECLRIMNQILTEDIQGHIGQQKYFCEILWRNGTLIMDEPTDLGGQDKGPDPFTTLLASLAGCTLSTLRMYIDRKGWDIPVIRVKMNLFQDGPSVSVFKRDIQFEGQVDDVTKERLLQIADKCPVSKLLKGSITVETTS